MKCSSCGAEMQMMWPRCDYCGTPNAAYDEIELQRQKKLAADAEIEAAQARQLEFERMRLAEQTKAEQERLEMRSKWEAEQRRLTAETERRRYISPKSRLKALLLCVFFGYIGVHRFYLGKVGTGLMYMFSGGGFYIGWAVDFLTILFGHMRDKQGRLVKDWHN